MQTSRREFLKLSGCITIGFTLGNFSMAHPLAQELPESLKRHPHINAWLEVLANGNVRIFTGKLELGQGIRTAIAQVAAEELDVAIDRTEVILADTARTPNEGYTAGSGSIEQSAMAVRYAAAAARAILMRLASERLNISVEKLTIDNGRIGAGGEGLSFAELLNGKQITNEVRPPVQLKPKEQYKIVGKPVPRQDISLMVRGAGVYVHDLRFKGMVHARVIRPSAYNAQLLNLDESYVKKGVPGLLKMVINGSFVGVIAADEYQAVRAQEFARRSAKWSTGPPPPLDDEKEQQRHFKTLAQQTERVVEKGKNGGGPYTHKASYFKPYMMHGSLGPSCAITLWSNNKLDIWTHSQGVYPLRDALAAMLRMPPESIHITGVPGSGCYGHNGADDVAADAALLAMVYPGKHVRLQWSREDEHGWEPYGSAMIMEAAATLNDNGNITDWKYDLWSDTHSTRPGGNAENLLAARYIESPFATPSTGYLGGAYRNSQPYYVIPNQQVDAHFFKGPLRVSALRSLGAYGNIFAIESFMDELAIKANKDPFTFRVMHLEDKRAVAVVQRLQQLIADEKTAQGSGVGVAFSRYKNTASYCAIAAKVVVNSKEQSVRVEKMWGVIDCGEVINLDGVKNQTEGGMIQAASWTLLEKVKFDQRHVTNTDWGSYPILRFKDAPEVMVEVLNQPHEAPLGAGEAAQGPTAAAIANAVFHACGKRIRELPILPEKIFAN